jgi:uncharacterized membrane protein YidH (DUF202 family)
MKELVMYRIAFGIAAFAAVLAWLDPGSGFIPAVGLFALALIICVGGVIEALGRCANALQNNAKTSSEH